MDNLFDIYIRDNEDWMEGIVDLLQDTCKRIGEIDKLIQKSNVNQQRKDSINIAYMNMQNITRQFVDRLDDLSKMRFKNETVEQQLKRQIVALELENTALKNNKGSDLNTNVTNVMDNMQLEELKDKVERMLELVEKNIKSMALTEYMKSETYKERDRQGEKSPRFNKDVNNERLMRMYIESGYKLTNDIVNTFKPYGIGYNGLMERLKKLGVWVYTQKKK